MAQEQQNALAERIEERIDKGYARDIAMLGSGAGAMFVPQSIGELMEFSKMMAVAGNAVPKHLRTNPGACMAVSMQAFRWGFDPFAVAQKSYSVNDIIAYESQLINSVVNTLAPIKSRPKITYEGEGQGRICIVSATIIGEDTPREVRSPMLKDISPKNSPLWKSDPDQQLAYYTTRTWARRHVPEVLLGVYAEDEIDNFKRSEQARDVTPAPAAPNAPAAPTRQEFERQPEVIDVNTEDAPLATMVADIERAIMEAPTAAELSEIWAIAGRDGDLDAMRRHRPEDLSRLSTLYNTRHLEFDEQRIEEERDEEQPSEAEIMTRACERAPEHFRTVAQIRNWIDGDFRAMAKENHLSKAQVARVEKVAQERIAALEAQ